MVVSAQGCTSPCPPPVSTHPSLAQGVPSGLSAATMLTPKGLKYLWRRAKGSAQNVYALAMAHKYAKPFKMPLFKQEALRLYEEVNTHVAAGDRRALIAVSPWPGPGCMLGVWVPGCLGAALSRVNNQAGDPVRRPSSSSKCMTPHLLQLHHPPLQLTAPNVNTTFKRQIKAREDAGWTRVEWALVNRPTTENLSVVQGRAAMGDPKVCNFGLGMEGGPFLQCTALDEGTKGLSSGSQALACSD